MLEQPAIPPGFNRRRGPKPGKSGETVAGAIDADQKVAELERRLGRLALENGSTYQKF